MSVSFWPEPVASWLARLSISHAGTPRTPGSAEKAATRTRAKDEIRTVRTISILSIQESLKRATDQRNAKRNKQLSTVRYSHKSSHGQPDGIIGAWPRAGYQRYIRQTDI